ncbi:MAG: hypothetical protein IT425_02255 [Pirellulales bacterium]|nr:hypothetical protein [Pirellulales bacterium]
MNTEMKQVLITMTQIEHVIQALEDLKVRVLPLNPQLFAVMAEAPLEDLARLRDELHEFVSEHAATA